MEDAEEGFELVEEFNETFQDEMDEHEREALISLLEHLQRKAVENMELFQDGSDASRSRLHAVFCMLEHTLLGMEDAVSTLFDVASNYDYNGLRANGYRSLLKIIRSCCDRLLTLSKDIALGKDNIFLSLRSGYRDIESFVNCLTQLKNCAMHLAKLPEQSANGCLFADSSRLYDADAEKMFSDLETLNRECFYGRCLGQQVRVLIGL